MERKTRISNLKMTKKTAVTQVQRRRTHYLSTVNLLLTTIRRLLLVSMRSRIQVTKMEPE
jgi:hypothetical protein